MFKVGDELILEYKDWNGEVFYAQIIEIDEIYIKMIYKQLKGGIASGETTYGKFILPQISRPLTKLEKVLL